MVNPVTINFSGTQDLIQHASGITPGVRPRSAEGKLLTAKQIRARMRRKMKRNELATDEEMQYLYRKPIEEWDLAELAHGRPKNKNGHFSGPKPKWITMAIHEDSMSRYTAAVKTSMRDTTVDALEVIKKLIQNDDVDEKGKYVVPPGTKLEAAKFLIEHVVGKPTQRLESEVSVKLQAILGTVMVNPEQGGGYSIGHYPGITMELAEAQDGDDDDLIPE